VEARANIPKGSKEPPQGVREAWAHKCYFLTALPDASNYQSLPKTKAEKYRLFEIVVDLGYRGVNRAQRVGAWLEERKAFRA